MFNALIRGAVKMLVPQVGKAATRAGMQAATKTALIAGGSAVGAGGIGYLLGRRGKKTTGGGSKKTSKKTSKTS